MQIQKGLVKYKDRSDIVCTYGLTEDGKQYYFLDGMTIANGNIIASTVLVEAIDPVVAASSIGVIDSNGNVVIPFENKSIKLISDDLLLVEKANSVTPSVVEAISLRSDPLAATKLVTTAATIKENMNAKMGSEGRFVFNDQFSEATICDINGNNIINDEYFSFIGMKNNESLYFSKNTTDSVVVEYSLADRMFIAPPEPENPEALDIQDTDVTQDIIDVAMAAEEKVSGFGAEDITAKDFEAVANENINVVEGSAPVEEPLPVEPANVDVEANTDTVSSVDATTEVDEENDVENVSDEGEVEEPISVLPEEKVEEEMEESTIDSLPSDEISENPVPVEEEAETELVSDDSTSTENEEESSADSEEVVVEQNDTNVDTATDDKLMSFDFGDNINYSDTETKEVNYEEDSPVEDVVSSFKSDLFDIDLDNDIFADATLHEDKIDIEDSFSYGYRSSGTKDTIMEDVANTMTNLINLNRNQRQKIAAYEEKFTQAGEAYRKVVEKAKNQIRDIETLKGKIKNYETIVAKLESKISMMENKAHDQDKVIASQTRELESLRSQIEGKEELAKILADAQSLLEQQ